jgi:CheY-like chemotaxis protein
VSDIAMPDVDGYSLIRNIRSLGPEYNSSVPALALTAYSTAEDVQRALSAGFDAHMAKPFETFPLGHEVFKLSKQIQR